MSALSAGGYVARPLTLSYNDMASKSEAAWKSNVLVRRCAAHEAFFSDYMRGCDGDCSGLCKGRAQCAPAIKAVVATLGAPNTVLWEVWREAEPVDFVGILRLSEYVPGCNAKAHYFFFDGRLKDKTPLLKAWRRWGFEELGLHRVTIEIPAYAKALASHAYRELGFGGQYKLGRIQVEGVMKDAIKWRGSWHDIYIMGAVSPDG